MLPSALFEDGPLRGTRDPYTQELRSIVAFSDKDVNMLRVYFVATYY